MVTNRLHAEQAAVQGLLELLEKAQECRQLYERAGMALPEPLKRLLSSGTEQAGPSSGTVQIPLMRRTRRPREAEADWVSIPLEDASPQSVVLAVLRNEGGPIRAKEVIRRVQDHLPDVPKGSIANIGTRLDEGNLIARSSTGWELIAPEEAGIILDEYLWAPASILSPQELAAYRREVVLHLLSMTQVGSAATQIEEQLRNCDWLEVDVNKDLVKSDLKHLASTKKIRRRGNTRKWELMPEENGTD